jgi:hypothetical protein
MPLLTPGNTANKTENRRHDPYPEPSNPRVTARQTSYRPIQRLLQNQSAVEVLNFIDFLRRVLLNICTQNKERFSTVLQYAHYIFSLSLLCFYTRAEIVKPAETAVVRQHLFPLLVIPSLWRLCLKVDRYGPESTAPQLFIWTSIIRVNYTSVFLCR